MQESESTLCADEALQASDAQAEAIQYAGDETYRIMAASWPMRCRRSCGRAMPLPRETTSISGGGYAAMSGNIEAGSTRE